jgi:hypothetical protein
MVLFVPESSSAFLVFSVRVDQTRRLDRKLVISKRAVFGWGSVIRVKVKLGTIRGEGRDACVSRGVRLSLVSKGLVPSVDECCSVIATL